MDPLAELATPAPWSPRPEHVRTLETHISRIYFVGERVYKVKKPVDLGFLDFTTLERRKHYCEAEVRLNEPLAPGVCLGVVPIVRDAPTAATGNGRLHVGGDGEIVDWAVEMRRLPDERMLSALLDRGEVDNQMWNELVDRLVRFHAEAATGPGIDEHGMPETVARNVRENFEQTRSSSGEPRPGTSETLCAHSSLPGGPRGTLPRPGARTTRETRARWPYSRGPR
jgi:aminoglycoside phosphotransferase family enzyme